MRTGGCMLLSDIKNRFNCVVNSLSNSLLKEEVEGILQDPDCVKKYLKLTDVDIKELECESSLYCKMGNWEEAIDSLGWLTFLESSKASHFLRLGSILLQIEQYAEALKILKIGSLLDLDNPEFFLYMGGCYLALGEKVLAKESFKMSIELSENNNEYNEIGLLAQEGILM